MGSSSEKVKNTNLSWRSLFSSAAAKLQFIALVVKDGKKSVVIPKSIFDQGTSLWSDWLLG